MAKTGPFDQHSKEYDAWFERNQDAYDAELKAVRMAMPASPVTGMEVGVGSGKFAVPLGIRLGVEPSEEMARKAERQGIRVFRNVAEALPFGPEEFDFVLMVTTICFVDSVPASFREAFRVLKPGGCIIVGFVDKESDLGRQYDANREKSLFYKEASFFSTQETSAYLADAGFVDLTFLQTLIPGEPTDLVQSGSGKGAFVVIKGIKSH
jgi:SAM-dependent methyltransferase